MKHLLLDIRSTVNRVGFFSRLTGGGFPSGVIEASLVKARWVDGHLGDSQQLLPRSQKGKGLSLQNGGH